MLIYMGGGGGRHIMGQCPTLKSQYHNLKLAKTKINLYNEIVFCKIFLAIPI